jgi:hypothetical protein
MTDMTKADYAAYGEALYDLLADNFGTAYTKDEWSSWIGLPSDTTQSQRQVIVRVARDWAAAADCIIPIAVAPDFVYVLTQSATDILRSAAWLALVSAGVERMLADHVKFLVEDEGNPALDKLDVSLISTLASAAASSKGATERSRKKAREYLDAL